VGVGFKGYFFACQRAAKHMVEQKRGGSLICLSSVHAVNPCEQWTVYGSCKAALERMVKGLAVDLRGTGISANAIAPVRATSGVIITSWSGSALMCRWLQSHRVPSPTRCRVPRTVARLTVQLTQIGA
jgi:NAD(P)-dependent dehydrogenase (short-subunit alcohol dehydrogenase family)